MELKILIDPFNPDVLKWAGGILTSGFGIFLGWYLKRQGVRRRKDIHQDELIQTSLTQTAQLAQSMKDSTEHLHLKIDELMSKIDRFQSRADRAYRDWETDRKSTRLNSSHSGESRMPSSA